MPTNYLNTSYVDIKPALGDVAGLSVTAFKYILC